ncbi:MAG: hypothetical protein PsegKO_04320 [Pseudohongiellaceae bacterium]
MPKAMASIDRLRVNWATSVLTAKDSLITGKAGNRICIAAGPMAEVAASSTISRLGRALMFCSVGVA